MSWVALSHILVFSSLLGVHVSTAVGVHPWRIPLGFDEYYYINAALSIYHGSYFTSTGPVEIVPLYPLWLSLLMHIDPDFVNFSACIVENWRTPKEFICQSSGITGIYAQAFSGAIGIGLAWFAGRLASGSLTVAHLSAFVALLVDHYACYNAYFYTENLVIPLFAGVNVCLAWLALNQRGRRGAIMMTGCGAMLGALILTRPPYEYLLAALPLAAVAWMFRDRSRRREIAVATAWILIGAALVVTPWVVRNYHARGFVGFTESYAQTVLAQRINYNDMTWRQWTAAFLYWSSRRYGRDLAAEVFGHEIVAPLAFQHPDYLGWTNNKGRKLLVGVAPKDQLGVLMAHVWSDLPKHLAVSIAMMWRGMNRHKQGMYGSPSWGVIFLLAIFLVLAWGTRRNRIVLLALTFCPVVILTFHALVSPNIPRYNIGLVTPLSVGVALPMAWVIGGAWSRLRRWTSWTGPRKQEPLDTSP